MSELVKIFLGIERNGTGPACQGQAGVPTCHLYRGWRGAVSATVVIRGPTMVSHGFNSLPLA